MPFEDIMKKLQENQPASNKKQQAEQMYQQQDAMQQAAPAPPTPQEQLQQQVAQNNNVQLNSNEQAAMQGRPQDVYLTGDRMQTAVGAANAYANQVGQAYADFNKAATDGITALEQAQQERQKTFADQILEARRDYEQQQAELEQDVDNDIKAARWTGATELAASIINLAGVGGLGASNQQYNHASVDWMKRVDRDKELMRRYRTDMREKLREKENQLAQLKAGDTQTIINMRNDAAKTGMQGRLAEQQARQAAADKAYQYAHQAQREAVQDAHWEEQMAEQKRMHDEQVKRQDAQMARQQEQFEAQMAMQGMEKGADGKWKYNASKDVKNSRSGSGSNKNIELALGRLEGQEKGERWSANPESIANTIYAAVQSNRISVDKQTQGEIKRIVGSMSGKKAEEIGAALLPLLNKNEQLREIARQVVDSAEYIDVSEWENNPVAPANMTWRERRQARKAARTPQTSGEPRINPVEPVAPADTSVVNRNKVYSADDLDEWLNS